MIETHRSKNVILLQINILLYEILAFTWKNIHIDGKI